MQSLQTDMKHTTRELQAVLDTKLKELGSRSVFVHVRIYVEQIYNQVINKISFVQLVKYKYGSEPIDNVSKRTRAISALKWNDPVRKVHFYKKETPWKAQPGEHSDLKALVCKMHSHLHVWHKLFNDFADARTNYRPSTAQRILCISVESVQWFRGET